MPEAPENRRNYSASGIAITATVIAWLFALMTFCLVQDQQAQIHSLPYKIPQFLVEVFTHTIDLVIDGLAFGTTLATAKVAERLYAERRRALEAKKTEPNG